MPAYKLAVSALDDLITAQGDALQQIRATAAILEQMDPGRSLTHRALQHNHEAEGRAVTVLRMAESLRELVRRANGGNPRPDERV